MYVVGGGDDGIPIAEQQSIRSMNGIFQSELSLMWIFIDKYFEICH